MKQGIFIVTTIFLLLEISNYSEFSAQATDITKYQGNFPIKKIQNGHVQRQLASKNKNLHSQKERILENYLKKPISKPLHNSRITPVISDYFKSKHIVEHGHVRRQLLSKKIKDDKKLEIAHNYMKKNIKAHPSPNYFQDKATRSKLTPDQKKQNVPMKKPFKMSFGQKNGNTLILASQRQIASRIKENPKKGKFDSLGNPVHHLKGTLPVMKTKTKFNTLTKTQKSTLVSSPAVQQQRIGVSFNKGRVNHFESFNKHLPSMSKGMSSMSLSSGIGSSKSTGRGFITRTRGSG